MDLSFYKGKKVLITGHTGFKGSWMCEVLLKEGADVIGYALEPPTNPSLFNLLNISSKIHSINGDVRDLAKMLKVFHEEKPEIVIHMAAQPIVRDSYKNPVYTYDVNVMGTVNILECVRKNECVKSFLNVTTDKVYKNKEWEWGYRENEEINGFDPYSNSKSCSELVTSCYKQSFYINREIGVSTARAGNVVGGGDFAVDRIIPDCVRNIMTREKIIVRNPNSVRPYQHVLEPIMAYLYIAKEQYINNDKGGNYNVGPSEDDCLTTGQLVDIFCKAWESCSGDKITWMTENNYGPHESTVLKLDCSHIKKELGWVPCWNIETAIQKTVEVYYSWMNEKQMNEVIEEQILCYDNQYV